MITNDVQYRNTKTLYSRFKTAVTGLERSFDDSTDQKLHQLQIDAAQAQADDLAQEISDYEQLKSGETTSFTADSLADVATLLIQARVARGWAQRQLAEELGIAEQQIQRYEANGYATASLTRLCEIADALGIQIRGTAHLATEPTAA